MIDTDGDNIMQKCVLQNTLKSNYVALHYEDNNLFFIIYLLVFQYFLFLSFTFFCLLLFEDNTLRFQIWRGVIREST